MEEKFVTQYYHEAETSRLERIIKRMWLLIIIMLLALIATNGAWLYYENQFQDTVTTTEQTVTQDVNSGDNGDAIIKGGCEHWQRLGRVSQHEQQQKPGHEKQAVTPVIENAICAMVLAGSKRNEQI